MKWLLKLRKRRALDRDLDEEMEFHRLMRNRDESSRAFGNATLIREEMREMWTLGWVELLMQDVKYSVRGMFRNPAFALTAVGLLALSIGANTAMFAVVKRVLIDPLPFPDSDRLVRIWHLQKQQSMPFSVTAFDYVDWAAQAKSFEHLAAYSGNGLTITGEGEPELIIRLGVSTNFFSVLGVRPALGRDFRPEESERGRDRVIVLSHALWQRKFGGSPDVIGRRIRANGESYEIIGVMPRGFEFPEPRYEAWTPIPFKGGDPNWTNRSAHYLRVIGRLKPGLPISAAAAEMDGITAQLERQYPETNRDIGARLRPLKDTLVGDSRSLIYLLYGAVTVLLLIACSNVASLLVARSAARRTEFAVRASLGASRLRLVVQVVVETAVLSLSGGVLGVGLAQFLTGALKTGARQMLPRIDEITLDPVVVAVSLGLSLFTGIVFGLAPAATLPRLVQSARGIAAQATRQRVRSTLVIAQIAMAMLLLTGAGLILRSFYNLSRVDLGYNDDGVVTMGFALMDNDYPTASRILGFARQLDERLSAAPGLTAAGFTTSLPLTGQGWGNPFTIQEKPVAAGGRPDTGRFQCVSPRYFQAVGTPLKLGRHLTPLDDHRSPLVALVDESFVKSFLSDGRSPVGLHLKIGGSASREPWREIVGVVAATRQVTLEGAPEPQIYLPFAQMGELITMVGRGVSLAGRSGGDMASAVGVMKSTIAALDPNLPVREVQLLRDRVDVALAPQRVRAVLMAGFAGLAVLLAAVGLYGVIAFTVTQRRQEIGVRMALGAGASEITRMVLAGGLRLTALGLAAGTVATLLLARFVERMLFGVAPKDVPTLLSVMVLLAAVALVASYLPAKRATRVDPMESLRNT